MHHFLRQPTTAFPNGVKPNANDTTNDNINVSNATTIIRSNCELICSTNDERSNPFAFSDGIGECIITTITHAIMRSKSSDKSRYLIFRFPLKFDIFYLLHSRCHNHES